MILVLDTGHIPGKDPGAIGNGLKEADLTGKIVDIILDKLRAYEVDIRVAPRGELSERAAFANQMKADFFFSVHVNAGGGTGYESFIHPAASELTETIAKVIHLEMATFYFKNGFVDRGLKRGNLAVLRETSMPAVLVENLFIDNKKDAAFLREHINEIGGALAVALVKGLGLKADPGPTICTNCQKLEAEIRRLRQVINNVGGILAAEMHK